MEEEAGSRSASGAAANCMVRSPVPAARFCSLSPRADLNGAALRGTWSWEALTTLPCPCSRLRVKVHQLLAADIGYGTGKPDGKWWKSSTRVCVPAAGAHLYSVPRTRQPGEIARLGCLVSFSTLYQLSILL